MFQKGYFGCQGENGQNRNRLEMGNYREKIGYKSSRESNCVELRQRRCDDRKLGCECCLQKMD